MQPDVLTSGLNTIQVGQVPKKSGEIELTSLSCLGHGQPLLASLIDAHLCVPRTPQPPGFLPSCLLLISLSRSLSLFFFFFFPQELSLPNAINSRDYYNVV